MWTRGLGYDVSRCHPSPKLGHTQTVPSTYTYYARHGDITYQCHQLRRGCWTVLLAPRFCYLRQTRQASMRTIFKEFRNMEDTSYRHFVKLDAIYITSVLPFFTQRWGEASIMLGTNVISAAKPSLYVQPPQREHLPQIWNIMLPFPIVCTET